MSRIRNRTIRLIAFRTIAALNLVFAIQGFWALGKAVFQAISAMPSHAAARYLPHFFIAFSACNVVFLFGLMVSASLLWEMRHRAVRRASILYVAMILFIFLKDIAGGLAGPWGPSATLAGLAGANAGLAWMELSGYPLVALVVLNVVKYLTRHSSHQDGAAASAR